MRSMPETVRSMKWLGTLQHLEYRAVANDSALPHAERSANVEMRQRCLRRKELDAIDPAAARRCTFCLRYEEANREVLSTDT